MPKAVRLSDIKDALSKLIEEPRDAYWFGRDSAHAVVEFDNAKVAEKVYRDRTTVKVLDYEITVIAFYK